MNYAVVRKDFIQSLKVQHCFVSSVICSAAESYLKPSLSVRDMTVINNAEPVNNRGIINCGSDDFHFGNKYKKILSVRNYENSSLFFYALHTIYI